MAAVAQSINKVVSIKMQTGLGSAASGSGGTVLTRTSSVSTNARDTNSSNVLTSDQQSRGISYGAHKPTIKTDSELTTETFALPIAGLLRGDFAAVSAVSGASITVAGSGPYTLTDAANTFLTAGIKVGMVIRLTAGTFNAANLNKNLFVTAVTETVITVVAVNGSALTAEGPISSATVTIPGKIATPPLTGQTNEYFTLEDWYPDVASGESEVFQDLRADQIDVSIPATGATTISVSWIGLKRTNGTSQVLTTPTEPTFRMLEAVNALIYINGVAYTDITTFSLSIQAGGAMVGPTIGNNYGSDVIRSTLMASGSLAALFDSTTLRDFVDSETPVTIDVVLPQDNTANAAFIAFSLGKCKLTSDTPDDAKNISRTFAFTAQLNDAGGAALARPETIISVQDSQL